MKNFLVIVLSVLLAVPYAYAADVAISAQTELASAPAEADILPIYDADPGAGKRITVLNLMKALEAALTGFAIHADNLPAAYATAANWGGSAAAPPAIGSGTPAAGTFTTLSAGAAGFAVDADGDVTAKSLSVTRVAGSASSSEYYEVPANGNGKIVVKAPDSINADDTVTVTWPSATGTLAIVSGALGTPSFTAVNLPSANADPGTTAGQISHDSTDTGSNSGGTAKWYDGAQVRSLVDTGTNYTIVTKTEYLPIRYAEDGTTGPAAAAEISTTTAIGRGFDKDADEDVVFWWVAPNDYVGGIKYRVIYALAADATADDTAVFSLAGCAAANSAALGCTPGTAVTLADELGTDDDQFQVMISDYSTEVTVTNIAAGSLNRLVFFRDVSEDDYTEGDLLVIGIEIKYKAKIMGIGDY